MHQVRSAIRQQTPSSYRTRGGADDLNLSVLDIWAAQQLQCRWQGFKVRRAHIRARTGIDLGAQARDEIREDRARAVSVAAHLPGGALDNEEERIDDEEERVERLGGDGDEHSISTPWEDASGDQMAVGGACADGGSSPACRQKKRPGAASSPSPEARASRRSSGTSISSRNSGDMETAPAKKRTKKKKNSATAGPMRAAATEPMAPTHNAAAELGACGWPYAPGTEPAVDLTLDC